MEAFMDQWVYNLDRILRSRLDALVPDLTCGDEKVEQRADTEASEILSLLYGPVEPESQEERRHAIEQSLAKSGLPPERVQAMAKRESRFTGRAAGRPRELGPDAIRALILHLTTEKSWREIALEVKGCNHICPTCGRVRVKRFEGGSSRPPRPKCPQCGLTIGPKSDIKRSCSACGDAMRRLAEEYKSILKRLGLLPKAPSRRELRGLSPEEIERIWPPQS